MVAAHRSAPRISIKSQGIRVLPPLFSGVAACHYNLGLAVGLLVEGEYVGVAIDAVFRV